MQTRQIDLSLGLQGNPAMMIRCPKCDRVGHLPDRLAPEARSLRCRRCQANFSTTEIALKASKQRSIGAAPWRGASLEPPLPTPALKSAPYRADGHYSRFDEPGAPLRELGPGDSNYEMTFSLEDSGPESGDDWEAGREEDPEIEAPSSDELEAIVPAPTLPPEPEPWSYRYVLSWGRVLCFGVLGFVALSVAIIGFLVACSLGMVGGLVLPAATQAFIVACFGTASLLLIGLAMVFQSVFLADLTRTIDRTRETEARRARA